MEPESPYERLRHIKSYRRVPLTTNVLEQNYRDWRYHTAMGQSQFDVLEATVDNCVSLSFGDRQNVRVFTILGCEAEFWYFEEADENFSKSERMKSGDKITMKIWKLSHPAVKSQFVKSILPPRRIPTSVTFTINYVDGTSLSVSTKDGKSTIDSLKYLLQSARNQKFKNSLEKQIKMLCISCGKEGGGSCINCRETICDSCNHVCDHQRTELDSNGGEKEIIRPTTTKDVMESHDVKYIDGKKIYAYATKRHIGLIKEAMGNAAIIIFRARRCDIIADKIDFKTRKYTVLPLAFVDDQKKKLVAYDLNENQRRIVKLDSIISIKLC